jgi:hypothetical protein
MAEPWFRVKVWGTVTASMKRKVCFSATYRQLAEPETIGRYTAWRPSERHAVRPYTDCCACYPCSDRITSPFEDNARTADCVQCIRMGDLERGPHRIFSQVIYMRVPKRLTYICTVRFKPPMDLQHLIHLA